MNFSHKGKVLGYKEFIFMNENLEIETMVLESLSSARKVYLKTGKINEFIFNQLINIDISKNKKYLEKLCKFYL